MGWVHFEVPKWLSLGLIAVTFLVAYVLRAHARGRRPDEEGVPKTSGAALLQDKVDRGNVTAR